MTSIIIGAMFGATVATFADCYLIKKYGYPALSIVSAKAYNSNRFKWMTLNLWGDDSWYYEAVLSHINGSQKNEEE